MSHITGFAAIPKGALSSFTSAVTVTATTTKTVLETIHAARPTIPASLLQNTTAAYEQAAKQSAHHGIVLANLNQMRPVVGLFLDGFIVSGGFYKLCERLAKVPPPSGETARYWRDKVKNTCTWLKRLFTSDERLRADLDRAHEKAAAAREEAKRARKLEKNTTKELERKENLEGAYDKLYRERAELAMEMVEVEDKVKALQHDLDQSPDALREQIRSLEQRLKQSQNTLGDTHLEAGLEEVRGRADNLNELLRDQETTYENKLTVAQSRLEEANAALRLSENELKAISIVAEDRRAQLETKDMDLKKAQELVASLQQSLINRAQAAISSNRRADELQAQLNERNNDLQQAHAHAENLQTHIDEQNHALQQAEAHTQAQQEEIDTAKSIEVELEQHITEYKQDLAEEVRKREAAETQLQLFKTPRKDKSKISASIRALASPLEARFLSGIPSSQPSVPHKQGHASPVAMPTSGAKHLNHADIEHMFDSSRSSTPSKHASEKCRLSSLYTEDELASSPSEPIVPLTHDTKAVDAMDITPLPTQHSSKPKLDFGVIPTLRPKIAITVPATPSHKTRSRRADLPQESPSRKSARSTAKPVSYRESALAALIVSPEKAIEKHENKDGLRASGVSSLKKSTSMGGRGGMKGKGRMGSDSFAASPSKKIVVKDVKEAGV